MQNTSRGESPRQSDTNPTLGNAGSRRGASRVHALVLRLVESVQEHIACELFVILGLPSVPAVPEEHPRSTQGRHPVRRIIQEEVVQLS